MIISELEKRIQDSIKGGKKNRVILEDYDLASDVRSRLMLSKINQDEFAVLEEILYSALTIPIERLAEDADLPVPQVKEFVERFEEAGLYTFDGKVLSVNKDRRKYFESHLEKFDETFSPGMEFLQTLLKNIPIQLLPAWYQIPRSSNNIFESLVEKYLLTPKTYRRYVSEFLGEKTLLNDILVELENTKDYKVYVDDICQKFHFSEEEITEGIIEGEFNFLFCSSFEPHLEGWKEVITPFAEWREYLMFFRNFSPKGVETHFEIDLRRNNEYAFIEDLTKIILACRKNDYRVSFDASSDEFRVLSDSILEVLEGKNIDINYANRLVNKLLVLGLVVIEEIFLRPTDHTSEWVSMPIEKRAHVTFKHPHNFLDIKKISPLSNERSILEIQKSMNRVAKLGWVNFTEFLEGCPIELSDEQKICLTKQGRSWCYNLPKYNAEEEALIKYTVHGMVL